MYSFNKEQAVYDNHNLVVAVMHEKGLGVQEAINYIGEWYYQLRDAVKKNFEELSNIKFSTPRVDELAKEYCWGMGICVSANIKWSFASKRYFGKEGALVMAGFKVELMKKERASYNDIFEERKA